MPSIGVGGFQPMPTGGTAGQVLTKTSSTDYAVGWATPQNVMGYSPIYVSGQFYSNFVSAQQATNSTTYDVALTSNASYYYAFLAGAAIPINRIEFNVNVAPSSTRTFTVGILNADPTTQLPGTVVATATGTVASGATAEIQTAITCTVPAGLSWIFIGMSGTGAPSLTLSGQDRHSATSTYFPHSNGVSGLSLPDRDDAEYSYYRSAAGAGILGDNPAVSPLAGLIPAFFVRRS